MTFTKLYNNDCLAKLKKIKTESIDLIFADPPYNLQLRNTLRRPDASKVSAVNDYWDKFNSFEDYDKFSNGICRISFKELCENPLSTADYLNLCNYVKVLFLENIPEISKSQNDLARRFINLIDIIYEGKVQLICLSYMRIDDIYNGTKLKKEFKRTISRLNEMQTNDWIN